MKNKINTTLSIQFQNPIENSIKEAKSILPTHIHDCSLYWFATGTLIKSGRVKLVLKSKYLNG